MEPCLQQFFSSPRGELYERGQHLVRAKGLAGRQQGHGLGDYIWVEFAEARRGPD